MRFLTIIFFSLFIIASCKKEDETTNTCNNGYVDVGEEGVDCGGVCPPCPPSYAPAVSSKFNETYVPFNQFSFYNLSNYWFLKYQNDTLEVQIKVGENLFVDSNYTVPPNDSYAIVNGITYIGVANPNPSNPVSVFGISELAIQDQRISGLFQVIFFRPGTLDTMRITSGTYTDIPF